MSDHAIDLFVNGVVGGFLGGTIACCVFLYWFNRRFLKNGAVNDSR